jgi:hypothetical protein
LDAVKFRTLISKITLSALALGAFFSCGQKQPQDPYPQDRVVGIIGYPVPSNLDSTWLAANRDSSGWKLHWTRPSDTTGNAIYIFAGSLTGLKAKLSNGTGGLNAELAPIAKLSARDTSWQIPSKFLHDRQGKDLRTDVADTFSIWVRYEKGPVADAPFVFLYLGDDIPPQLPFVRDSAGQTSALLWFARPQDKTSTYDSVSRGPLKSVRVLYWPGTTPKDSAGKTKSVSVSDDTLKNTAIDSFRLTIPALEYYTSYCYSLEIVDAAKNMVRSDYSTFTTMDKDPPSSPSGVGFSFVRLDSAVFSWSAASDTFQSDPTRRKAFPNYRIQRYVVRLNGQRIDSAVLDPGAAQRFQAGVLDTALGNGNRFRWNGASDTTWTWTWRSFRPGKAFRFELIAYDFSGNMADSTATVSGTGLPKSRIPGLCDSGWVVVRGDSSGLLPLSNFCIEEHEHLAGSSVRTRVTWSQAIQICSDAGAQLCSDDQWVRACESFPDTPGVATYGAVDVGSDNLADTLAWLRKYCQVGTGDSVAMRNPTNADPRCVSGWGVYDMPGRVGEWTRDVYLSSPDTATTREAGTRAYLGVSDLTLAADLGTIHGGSALVLDQLDLTLASARCRERNYPATATVDTLPSGLTRFHPLPQGMSSAWGFRCCKLLP